MARTKTSAFTLIELSIALVIIGLVVGGVLVGQDLIFGAKKRSLMAEQVRYATAVTTFKTKYNGLPGDISNPTMFFGNVFDGQVGNNNKTILWSEEGALAWKQLALAALIEGDISPANFASAERAELGTFATIPESRAYKGAGWALGVRLGTNTNTMFFGRPDSSAIPTYLPIEGAIDDLSLWEVDEKLDDGLATTGRMRTTGATCASGNDYTVTGTTQCAFEIELGL